MTPVSTTRRCAGWTFSTGIGWSSLSVAPARSTGPRSLALAGLPRSGPLGCRSRRPRRPRPSRLRARLQGTGTDVVEEAREVHARLTVGLEHVVTDPDALACFRFMNEVMRDQWIQTQIAADRGADPKLSYVDALVRV